MADEREPFDEPALTEMVEPPTNRRSRRNRGYDDRGTISDSRIGRSVRRRVRRLDSSVSEGSIVWLFQMLGKWIGYFFTSVNEWSKLRRMDAQRRAEDRDLEELYEVEDCERTNGGR